jgi:hypothetical protein
MFGNFVLPVVFYWGNYVKERFMQGGTPPHFGLNVRAWLDNHFPVRWIGRSGPPEWSP